MASESMIKLFVQRVNEFKGLDKTSIYRNDLGKYSLEPELKVRIDSLIDMLQIDESLLKDFPESILQDIVNTLQDLRTTIERQRNRTEEDFITRGKDILAGIVSRIDQILLHSIWFKMAKIDDLSIEDVQIIKKEYDEFKAKIEADSKVVRESATGQSLKQAQEDFAEGAELNRKQAWLWGKISIWIIAAFIGFALYLMLTGPGELAGIEIAYYTAIRITLFFALATLIAFCLKILRDNLLLSERNAHKARLTNNLKPLIAAAPENQLELVLSILIQEISSFGKTGLLQKEDDSISVLKNVVDTALKNRPPS